MGALRELLAESGHENVRTLLQSGNVILESRSTGTKLERELERQLEAGLGFKVDGLRAHAQRAREGRRAQPAQNGCQGSGEVPRHVPAREARSRGRSAAPRARRWPG